MRKQLAFHFVLGHFVNQNMLPKHLVLGVKPIKTRAHTAEKLSEILGDVLKLYSLKGSEKLFLILRDGEATMGATTRLLGVESQWCFAHILNLAVKDGLKQLPNFSVIQ